MREAGDSVAERTQEGSEALRSLPGIGKGLAGVITEIVHTGRSGLLARLQGEVAPEDLFVQLPGIGDVLAEAGELRKIAPKRFNPDDKAWLPIMHTEKEGWAFTALYSNTARAHELDATHDWVVIYYERDGYESQATVVTEKSGPLRGKRVVRGRERASRRYYEQQETEKNG